MKSILKKFKRQKKRYKIPFLIIGILYAIATALFIQALLLLAGIETAIRWTVIGILCFFQLLYFFLGIILLFSKKYKRLVTYMVLTVLFIPILGTGFYYINKTYSIIDNVQKKYVDYTSVMITLSDASSYEKIGIINNESDATGYIIPQDIIKENAIKGDYIKFEDYASMISALYEGEIDALFIEKNYASLFSSIEKYENIEKETKVVFEKSKKLENADNVSYSTKDLTEPFSILLLGVDGTGSGITSASFNGDTMMLITFNPKTLSATIFSIPRDTFVPISCYGNKENKINSSAYGGTTCVVNTIQNLTGINIDYYMKINFTGAVKLVDDLGGIYVDVPIKFCEQDSQRRHGKYEICLDKGYQLLNGEQALAFSRHRKTLPLGDFQRVQHQQMVLEAMLNSMKNINSIDTLYAILEDISDNMDTNMTTNQILSIYTVGKNVLFNKVNSSQSISITKTYLTGYDLTPYIPSMRSYAYTFQYYRQSLDEIVDAMKVNLELKEPTITKHFDFDANETYEKKVIGKTYYNETKRTLVPNFVGQSKSYVDAWALGKNVSIKYTTVDSSSPSGVVVSQDIHAGQIFENISSITIGISNGKNVTVETNKDDTESYTDETEE